VTSSPPPSRKSIINPHLERETPELAYTAKSIQLLAGELAGRRYADLPLDEVCVALRGPTRVDERTRYNELILPTDELRNRDEIRVLDYIKGVRTQDYWWEWFWAQHAEASRVLGGNWGVVLEVAKRILAVEPYMNDEERRRGTPSRRIEGDVLIGWLREQNAPVKDPQHTSVHYQTDD
jgi:hypothetical protein